MRLTPRCLEILKLLLAARWLTTTQLHRRFFSEATLSATRKRLHKLAKGDYLVKVQPNRMQESFFRLGPAGKRQLEQQGGSNILLHRQPPKQLEHFLGINDVRLAAELSLPLSYFFACWELAAIGWKQPIIPDAIFGVDNHNCALEFDRGQENLRFFARTKLAWYFRGLDGFPVHRLVIVTDRQSRLESLAKAVGLRGTSVRLTRLDLIQKDGLAGPIFCTASLNGGIKLL